MCSWENLDLTGKEYNRTLLRCPAIVLRKTDLKNGSEYMYGIPTIGRTHPRIFACVRD